MREFELWPDGACEPNPGVGGWGFVLVEHKQIIASNSGGLKSSTNNRAELTALIEGLRSLPERPAEVRVYSDSMYVVMGGAGRWRCRTNADLWARLAEARKNLVCHYHHVPGHSGIEFNEAADHLAGAAIKNFA